MNDNILKQQAEISDLDDTYLADQLRLPQGEATVNQFLAAVEMSKRSKMRQRAGAIADMHKSKGTVIEDTLSGMQPSAAPVGYAEGGLAGYGGVIPKSGWDWRLFGGSMPERLAYREKYPEGEIPGFFERNFPNSLPAATARNQRREDYDADLAVKRSQYPVPAGPHQAPLDMSAGYDPYKVFSGLPIQSTQVAAPEEKTDPVAAGTLDAANIFTAIRPSTPASQAAPSQAAPQSSVLGQYDKLLAGINSETPGELVKPKVLDSFDTARSERLNRAMALGAMAKSFSENPEFIGGFGAGVGDATAAMAAGRSQVQKEKMEQARVQSAYDLANSEQVARERLANRAASQNINLAKINAVADQESESRRADNQMRIAEMDMAGRERLAQMEMSLANQRQELEWRNRAAEARLEREFRAGDREAAAKTQLELENIRREADRITASATRDLGMAKSVMTAASSLAGDLLTNGTYTDPTEAYQAAISMVTNMGQPGQPPAGNRPRASALGIKPAK